MLTPGSDQGGRIVRILTYGKESEVIERAILDAVEAGQRVLVKVFPTAEAPAGHSAGASAAVADWAEALSQEHGLAWERLGGDVLFHRSRTRAVPPPPEPV